jgi:hypothetical protein
LTLTTRSVVASMVVTGLRAFILRVKSPYFVLSASLKTIYPFEMLKLVFGGLTCIRVQVTELWQLLGLKVALIGMAKTFACPVMKTVISDGSKMI